MHLTSVVRGIPETLQKFLSQSVRRQTLFSLFVSARDGTPNSHLTGQSSTRKIEASQIETPRR